MPALLNSMGRIPALPARGRLNRPGIALLVAALCAGCVERRMKIATNPPGAQVIINDEEVGASPVKFSFLWYGDYDIIVRKPGYETLKTHYRVNPPWWQRPVIDIVPETLLPWTFVDEHELPTLMLAEAEHPTNTEIVERARELRERAVFTK